MPRRRRCWTAGAGAHFISRFVDRSYLLTGDDDRPSLLRALEKADHRWDWSWLSFAMMSNHVHYGTIATEATPDRFLLSAHTRFAQQFHRRHGNQTLGPVFADRPKLIPVAEEGLLRLVAYHHRNPVEAKIVERPHQSRWTSHRAYLRLDPAPAFLRVERALALLGFEDTAAGRRRFDDAIMDTNLELPPRAPEPTCVRATRSVDWDQLLAASRRVAGLGKDERLTSKRPAAVTTRLLVAMVAIRDFNQPPEIVARHIGMQTGSISNLLSRKGPMATGLVAQVRLLVGE